MTAKTTPALRAPSFPPSLLQRKVPCTIPTRRRRNAWQLQYAVALLLSLLLMLHCAFLCRCARSSLLSRRCLWSRGARAREAAHPRSWGLSFLSSRAPYNASRNWAQKVKTLQAVGPSIGGPAPDPGRPRRQPPPPLQQPERLASLYTLMRQQQQQPPADDGVLQQLVTPENREQYLKALRQVGRSSYLSHLQRPVLPLDLRPWLQQELQQEEKKLAALSEHLQQQLQLQLQQGTTSSSPGLLSRLQHLRDEKVALLLQVQYLKERIHALDVLMMERQPPPLLLHLLQAAAKGAKQPQHMGSGPASAVLAAAAAASGSASAAADPIAATLSATETADFPLTVPPAAVTQQQQPLLRRFGLVPRWLLGKGLGALGRPQGLAGQRGELEAFAAAGWAEDFPLLQQLPGETPREAAARKVKAAAVRLIGGCDAHESPLEYKQRMQQLLEHHQQQHKEPNQLQRQEQQRRMRGASSVAAAAAALQLQQEARNAQLPDSALQLLSRYAHQRPDEMRLRGTPAENAELVQRAATDLQLLFSRMASAAAATLSEQTEVKTERPPITRQFGGAERDPVHAWIDQYHEDLRKREEQEAQEVLETAVTLARRKLALLRRCDSSHIGGTDSKKPSHPVMQNRRQQHDAIKQSLEEARILNVTEKYFELLQQIERGTSERTSEKAASTPGEGSLSPLQMRAQPVNARWRQSETLEAREKRVAEFIETASAALFRRAADALGSRAVASGGRVFPGMLVKGRVVRVLRQSAILDIGVGRDAWLMAKDVLLPLEAQPQGGLRQLLKEGDTLYCVVDVASPKELRLSLLPLRQLAAWEVLTRAAQTQETLFATKQQAIPGGLVVRVLGIQGFLPASHVCDTSLLQPPQQPLQHQQPVVVQVLHADVSRRRLLVSQRLPVSRTELMLRRLAPGDLVSGTIVDIHTFGCVVQFGSSRALLHVSEMSHFAVDAALVFRMGEAIRAIVKSYDPATGKIWLSTKALERYPGQILQERQKVFDEAEAAAARYKEQQQEIQQLQEAAAQQLMRSLGIATEQTPAGQQATKGSSTVQGNEVSLWWGLNNESKLLEFLDHLLQQKKKAGEAISESTQLADEAPSWTSQADTDIEALAQLPGGGAVRVRALQNNEQKDRASILAAAASEAMEIRTALQQSKVLLRGNWQVPKVFEGPLENEQWEFV